MNLMINWGVECVGVYIVSKNRYVGALSRKAELPSSRLSTPAVQLQYRVLLIYETSIVALATFVLSPSARRAFIPENCFPRYARENSIA